MAKLYDIVLRQLKENKYSSQELRESLKYFRLSKQDIKDLERDLLFTGQLERVNQRTLRKKKQR
jgi:hypothetical protein